mmetsp:Transcript_35651/g.112461  ORF Transcript_35651/g.112461 Transcript_35651/m.112461 type:complete len:208 (+) Transcript_35651:540-1163(+)
MVGPSGNLPALSRALSRASSCTAGGSAAASSATWSLRVLIEDSTSSRRADSFLARSPASAWVRSYSRASMLRPSAITTKLPAVRTTPASLCFIRALWSSSFLRWLALSAASFSASSTLRLSRMLARRVKEKEPCALALISSIAMCASVRSYPSLPVGDPERDDAREPPVEQRLLGREEGLTGVGSPAPPGTVEAADGGVRTAPLFPE